jgi:hypothetical protein
MPTLRKWNNRSTKCPNCSPVGRNLFGLYGRDQPKSHEIDRNPARGRGVTHRLMRSDTEKGFRC